MKHLVKSAAIAAAVAAFAIGGALAETNRMGTGAGTGATTGMGTGMGAGMGAGQTFEPLTTIPGKTVSVNHWLDQNVFDASGTKIGEVEDLLISEGGRIEAVIVEVGGFLGMGEKDVAVPLTAIQAVERDGKWRLSMNTTKEALRSAPSFKQDKNNMNWRTN